MLENHAFEQGTDDAFLSMHADALSQLGLGEAVPLAQLSESLRKINGGGSLFAQRPAMGAGSRCVD